MTETDRFAIGATCFVIGLALLVQGWRASAAVGIGIGMMLTAAWRLGRR